MSISWQYHDNFLSISSKTFHSNFVTFKFFFSQFSREQLTFQNLTRPLCPTLKATTNSQHPINIIRYLSLEYRANLTPIVQLTDVEKNVFSDNYKLHFVRSFFSFAAQVMKFCRPWISTKVRHYWPQKWAVRLNRNLFAKKEYYS